MSKSEKIEMKNKIIVTIIILISIFLIINIRADTVNITAGNCNSIEFPNSDPINWSVEGNSSDMNGFMYIKNGTNITYCFDALYKPDNFTITFYNLKDEVVVQSGSSGGGGGSSRSYYLCGNGVCDYGETSATCLKDCPVQTLSNENGGENKTTPIKTQTQTGGLFGITGGAILNFVKSGTGIAILIVIILILVLVVIVSLRKK